MSRRLRFNAFSMNCVSHIHHGQWVRPDTRQVEYLSLDPWVELAQLLERGKFDALFLADVVGTYDSYRGSRDVAVREGLQIPVNDPSLLIPALASVTDDLGFAFTHSVLQEQPFNFARRISTLDHLSDGRVAWNIVTSYLEDAGRNLGFGGLPAHDERYARAEEYVEVLYKLWEGSWEDDAVVRDLERAVHADPAKIHDVDHSGPFYPDVPGPHLSEPSPQRTPVLFQAGSSERGREFAARNAEAIFIASRNPLGARTQIADTRERAKRFGREPGDILFYQGLSAIVGGTEEEALAKQREIDEFAADEGYAAHMAGNLGIDLAEVDLDAPVGDLETANVQAVVRGLVESAPDKEWRFGDLLRYVADLRVVGTPEQIADELQEWADAGVDGINLMYHTTPGSFVDFIEGVTPVLQERGLAQREYVPGTLREKLSDGRDGPLLNPRHPGAAVRRERLAGAAA
ncbi:MAG TPA: LLM class flavin-dependent oxidoreductase [Solirubrobacterales bacterium]|nr:LLM class flavin-dependent oxidoreductase [Solirubrobacterales bacterium]